MIARQAAGGRGQEVSGSRRFGDLWFPVCVSPALPLHLPAVSHHSPSSPNSTVTPPRPERGRWHLDTKMMDTSR